jgi:hypothetical protein
MAETRREIKGRRSPAEKTLADGILAKAAKYTPDPAAFASAKAYAEVTQKSKRFEQQNRTAGGLLIQRFRKPGEQITGVLGECNGTTGLGESTYPIVQDDGSVVCVPGNRRLVRAFRKAKCKFQRIRITYQGKLYTGNGRYEKVYLVESAKESKR